MPHDYPHRRYKFPKAYGFGRTNEHSQLHWYLAPADNPLDRYAAGYDGNAFYSRAEAEAMIPELQESGPDFDIEWIAVDDRDPWGSSQADRRAHTTKATREGQADAITWMNENPRSEWADAIRPGTLAADEALINALGVEEAAKLLGVSHPYTRGGFGLTKRAEEAFAAYSRAWAATVREALARNNDESYGWGSRRSRGLGTHDAWKDTWDWAKHVWGGGPRDHSLNHFFRAVARLRGGRVQRRMAPDV